MTKALIDRLTWEMAYYGLGNHPLAKGLPGILRVHQQERRSSRRWVKCCTLLLGFLLGTVGSLTVIWMRLDALSVRSEMMAMACLNPGKPPRVSPPAGRVTP